MDQTNLQQNSFFNSLHQVNTSEVLNSSSSDGATSPDYSDRSVNTNDSGIDSAAISGASTPQNYPTQVEQQFQQIALMHQNSEMFQKLHYNNFAQQNGLHNFMPIFNQNPQLPLQNYQQPAIPEAVMQRPPVVPSADKYVQDDITDEALAERIKVTLGCEDMWKLFENHQTEMIITKGGRNLFPKLTFKIKGLEPANCYLICLKFRRVTDQKYKYSKGEWQPAGKADDIGDSEKVYPASENCAYPPGREWMQSEISFGKLKLTNNPDLSNNKNAVVLRSMHKYRPVLQILRYHPKQNDYYTIEKEIERAEFIAVTAYQNTEVTKLKIQNNPFAKGFREGGRKRNSTSNDGPPVKQQPNAQNSMPFMINGLLNNPMNYLNNLSYYPQFPSIQQPPYFPFN